MLPAHCPQSTIRRERSCDGGAGGCSPRLSVVGSGASVSATSPLSESTRSIGPDWFGASAFECNSKLTTFEQPSPAVQFQLCRALGREQKRRHEPQRVARWAAGAKV